MKFLKRIMIQKMAKRAVQGLMAFLLAYGVDTTLTQMGITIDWQQFEVFLTGLLFVILEGVRNYLKVKTGWKFL